ncbi:MAG: hypothetical protein WAO98_08330, partial [Alphaproteobacteria bacterium]
MSLVTKLPSASELPSNITFLDMTHGQQTFVRETRKTNQDYSARFVTKLDEALPRLMRELPVIPHHENEV